MTKAAIHVDVSPENPSLCGEGCPLLLLKRVGGSSECRLFGSLTNVLVNGSKIMSTVSSATPGMLGRYHQMALRSDGCRKATS